MHIRNDVYRAPCPVCSGAVYRTDYRVHWHAVPSTQLLRSLDDTQRALMFLHCAGQDISNHFDAHVVPRDHTVHSEL